MLQETHSQASLDQFAKLILRSFPAVKIIILEGDLGAGKTFLIKTFLKILGVKEPVSSPTFSLVHFYNNSEGAIYAHLDLYRVLSIQEAHEAGLDEVLAGNYEKIFVEWGSRIPELFENEKKLIIQISGSGHSRLYQVNIG